MHYVHTCGQCVGCIVYICALCWGLLRIMCWDVCVLCGCVVIDRSCAGCRVGVGRGCWVQDWCGMWILGAGGYGMWVLWYSRWVWRLLCFFSLVCSAVRTPWLLRLIPAAEDDHLRVFHDSVFGVYWGAEKCVGSQEGGAILGLSSHAVFLFAIVFQLLVVVINVFHFLPNYSCCEVNGLNCECSAVGAAAGTCW